MTTVTGLLHDNSNWSIPWQQYPYTHTHIHTHIHIHPYTYIHTLTHIHSHTYPYTHAYSHIHTHTVQYTVVQYTVDCHSDIITEAQVITERPSGHGVKVRPGHLHSSKCIDGIWLTESFTVGSSRDIFNGRMCGTNTAWILQKFMEL